VYVDSHIDLQQREPAAAPARKLIQITSDDQGAGPIFDQGSKTLKGKQVAFDAEITAIEEALKWYQGSNLQHLVIHSDFTSAIARASHSSEEIPAASQEILS
jgi:hypothetical protein